MTETTENPAVIDEVLALIDRGLGDFSDRQLLSAGEVADLLLDVRSLLTRPEALAN